MLPTTEEKASTLAELALRALRLEKEEYVSAIVKEFNDLLPLLFEHVPSSLDTQERRFWMNTHPIVSYISLLIKRLSWMGHRDNSLLSMQREVERIAAL